MHLVQIKALKYPSAQATLLGQQAGAEERQEHGREDGA